MRVMVLVKATEDSEAGVMPTTELFEAMGRFNEELIKAGIMLAGDGLKPSSQGKRVAFDGPSRTVIDGPFAETRELVAGYWLWEVKDMDEAVEWVKRCPNPMSGPERDRDPPVLRDGGFRRVVTPEVAERCTSSVARRTSGRMSLACRVPGRPSPVLSETCDGNRNPPGDRGGLPDRAGAAHRRPGADGARRGPGRGAGAGRVGHGPLGMAADRGSGQSRRLADGRGQAPGDRRLPPRQDARAQARRDRPRPVDADEAGIEAIEAAMDDDVGDELLGLIFAACHPVLSPDARVALTLRLIGGLTTDEIARAYLVSEPTVAQRIVRAKRRWARPACPSRCRGAERRDRLASVLEVVYLIFNEGYCGDCRRGSDPSGAVRRGAAPGAHPRGLMPDEPEVFGLLALMETAGVAPGGPPRPGRDADAADRAEPGPVGPAADPSGPLRPGARRGAGRGRRSLCPAGRARRLSRAGAPAGGDRLATDRGALRCASGGHALAGGGAQPGRGPQHGLRPGGRPRAP